jgi:hypothetical protein
LDFAATLKKGVEGTSLALTDDGLPRREELRAVIDEHGQEINGGQGMKRIVISAVLALALAGTTAFAAQTKTATAKSSTAKPAAAGTMTTTGAKKHVKRRKKHAAKTMADSNAAGTMTGAAKKPAIKKGKSNK